MSSAYEGNRKQITHWAFRIPESGPLWNNYWRQIPIAIMRRPGNRTNSVVSVGPVVRRDGIYPYVEAATKHHFGFNGITLRDLLNGFFRDNRGYVRTIKFLGLAGQRRFRHSDLAENLKPYNQKRNFKG